MTKLEVRCCCNPAKMLGWLKVPTDNPKKGEEFSFRTTSGGVIRLEVGHYYLAAMDRIARNPYETLPDLRPDKIALKSGGQEKEIQEIIGFRKK